MATTLRILLALTLGILAGAAHAEGASQYNMSLQDKVITGPKGSLTSPQAASVNMGMGAEEKNVRKIADGIYRIAGWGIGNIIAVEGPEGWIIVDAGDYLEVAREQRLALEDKVGKIHVAAVLYTHSHYASGAKAWQDENTRFYGHEDLVPNLNARVSVCYRVTSTPGQLSSSAYCTLQRVPMRSPTSWVSVRRN